MGTSAPEMFVSAIASYTGHNEVAMGNVIGSNITNVALVLALTALIFPIRVHSNSVKIDAPIMIIVSLILFFFILNYRLGRLEGLILVVVLIIYVLYSVFKSRREDNIEENIAVDKLPVYAVILMIVFSIGGLAIGSELLVSNASRIALRLGVSERVIAVTLIAFGTSLPELSTSIVAAFKKEMDISIGNIIGSNIFNILGVLGISSLVKPMNVTEKFVKVDIYWMISVALLLFLFILPFKGGKLTRVKAGVLLLSYCSYIYFLLK
jgi:cation:H+ antiporter